jgi:pimeloyl-ACP methyl ester carboxylesterase
VLGELVRITTADQTPLIGMLFEPEPTPLDHLVIHLHGSLGNFYGNPFIDYFARFYPARGVAFLSVNNRGHDLGGITERFEDCLLDIESWLQFARKKGYKRVLLQGHSLGALKATYYILSSTTTPLQIDGLILLSPFDLIAFYSKNDISTRSRRLEFARAVAVQNPDTILPLTFWDYWPISAGTFINLVGHGTVADLFPFRNHSSGSIVKRIQMPIFVAIGSDDFAAYPTPTECISQLEPVPAVTAELIEDAPHNFAGYEKDLLRKIATWLVQESYGDRA